MIPEDGYLRFCPSQSKGDRFHVCTVANYARRHLEKLILSCKCARVDLKILGMGKPYPQHRARHHVKLLWMLDYLHSLEEDEIVMFVDGFDVLLMADRETIIKKFKNMQVPLVISAERACYPLKELAEQYPSSPTPFKYINSGSYIGYVKHLKKWLLDMNIHDQQCDQAQVTVHYLKDVKKFLTLDYMCELFIPLYLVEKQEIAIDQKAKTVYCKTSQSYPCVAHANAGKAGGAFTVWNAIYDKIIDKNLLHKFLK